MKKFLLVFALAFVAFTQMVLAGNPVINVYVEGPDNTTSYVVYVRIVDVNENVFGTQEIHNGILPYTGTNQTAYLINIPQPSPSPKVFCKVIVGVALSNDPYNPIAGGSSGWMSYEEVTTSAEWVKVRF